MRILLRSLPPLLTLLLLVTAQLHAQATDKRPLGHDDYDRWNRLQAQALSADGEWLRYIIAPRDGDATLFAARTSGDDQYELERGTGAAFTADSRFLVFRIQPADDLVQEARDEGKRGDDLPQDSLGILDLRSGDIYKVERVRSFRLPAESSDWLAYHLRAEPTEREERRRPQREEVEEEEEEEVPEAVQRRRRNKSEGTTLVLRNLRDGTETRFDHVTSYRFTEDGSTLIYIASCEEGEADGIYAVNTSTGQVRPVLTGEGVYRELTVDEDNGQLAFLTDRDDFGSDEDQIGQTLYHAALDGREAVAVAREGMAGIRDGWWVSQHGSVNFSGDGSRVFFGTAPRPEPEPDNEEEDELLDNVELDLWSWHDPFLQPHQLNDLRRERNRTYLAVVFLEEDRILQLADETLQSVSVPDQRNADVALGHDDRPYRQRVSWDTRFTDVYLVDVSTGERELIISERRGSASISRTGQFVYWWDGGVWQGDAPRGHMVMDLETRRVVNTTSTIPVPVYNELSDRPAPPGSYGLAGWTEDDQYMLVNDAYDIWLVDPRGRVGPRNLTAGYGRANDLRLRVVRMDWDGPFVPLDQDVLLSAFNMQTKADGYYRTRLDRARQPQRLVMEDVSFSSLRKADEADKLIFNKSTFQMFPDVWISDTDFRGQRRMTEANPQQQEYIWGSAELVTWTSNDGEELQGILYKPENFDPAREWPLMVYFYERSSNGLHRYFTPSTGTSINRTFYVSRGYVLFVPDIPYKTGYPGESAMNAVVPGIASIVNEGYIDRDRIGVQGHSWGGYQILYMLTRTNIFAAAESGAPVSNMTSAYGGIRWGSGRVRQMQYETGQSRIGGHLWEAQHRYIENSPLFTAYKVETPLLILHNDEDDAVPFEQGIEFFVALRRLGKPVWMVNYNGERHGIRNRHNQRDFTIRMQQFFDHYLQGAPPPTWMVDGIPALQKGRTLGHELVTEPPDTQQATGGRGGGNR